MPAGHEMITLRVEPIGINIQIDEGKTLSEGLKSAGIFIEKPCGGMGVCAKCGVFVDSPEKVPSTPHEDISCKADASGLRLACRAVPESDITLRLTDHFIYGNKNGYGQGKILVKSHPADPVKLNPAVKITDKNGVMQLWHDRALSPVILDEIKEPLKPKGLAVDIGTTTLAISLVCLESGRVLASGADLNPQVVHGHDVLARIQYAKTQQLRCEMASLVKDKLNSLLSEVCKSTGTRPEEIVDITLGANTAMLQLAAGMDSASMGRSPFNFDIKGGCSHPAVIFGLNVNKAAKVYLPPIMHAFVGTDISAGLVLCPDFFKKDKIVLFIDMGTNGELCLNVKGRWYAASTAAGPAFEGMGLSSGMRAMDGAVDRVDYLDGKFSFHTIGECKINGICGSGIIDFLAELLSAGVMDATGRLLENGSPHTDMVDLDGVPAFQYADGFYFTQKDIRQVQLALSAVRTGIELILHQGGIKSSQLDKIYLAGGFGACLSLGKMSRIGLLQEGMAKKVVSCGNASLGGSIALLTNKEHRCFLETILDEVNYISLAKTADFKTCFMANLDFPLR